MNRVVLALLSVVAVAAADIIYVPGDYATIQEGIDAASAGDIGRHFPDTDPQWRGASSLDLLGRALGIVRRSGFRLVNVDAVVVAERPKLAPHVAAIIETLARVLGLAPEAVSVKAKTNEGLGEVGRGEAIAAHAVALLVRY